jgi:hypothetical protein
MGCVVAIPERGLNWRRKQDGVSLQVQRRKFQSLIGVKTELQGHAFINRFMSISKIGSKFSHGLPLLNLRNHAITISGGVSLHVQQQRFADFDNYPMVNCPLTRSNSSLQLNTATHKPHIVRLKMANHQLILFNLEAYVSECNTSDADQGSLFDEVLVQVEYEQLELNLFPQPPKRFCTDERLKRVA